MSTSIENRIVGLQFDNKNFEKNVDHTITALDRLERKLSFKGAEKGFSEYEKKVSRIDLSGLDQAADMIQKRFSAIGIAGMATIDRVTNAALSAGSRLINNFTLDPLRQGYQEYELKMGSVQTIMASTGEAIDVVNGYLEELNRYSDRTIYSFSDMTQNIGKFTNAGVKLEDAVKAIQGISNEAAVSGANANEASRAMYNFSQALSAGYVKLIDWKSIENANMATREFKQELINTAVAMGTLKKANNGEYRAKKLNITATKNFNDSLHEQWLTSEVLIETLGRYADENTDIGKKAFAAAQDIKTFTQLISTVKESIGSQWAMISEFIIGDLEEAKELWTDIGKAMSNMVDGFFGPINKFLSNNLASNYDKWLENGPIADSAEFNKHLEEAVQERNEPIQEQIDQNNQTIESYKLLQKQWLKYNDFLDARSQKKQYIDPDTGKAAWIQKPKQIEQSADEIEALKKKNEELGKSLSDTSFHAETLRKGMLSYFDDNIEGYKRYKKAGFSNAEALEALGLSDEEFAAMRKYRGQLLDGTVDVYTLAKSFNELSNRKKLIDALGKSISYLGSYLTPVKEAFSEVFFGEGFDSNWLGKLANKFYNFANGLNANQNTLRLLKNGFKTIFGEINLVFSAIKQVGSGMKVVLKPIWSSLGSLGNAILEVFGHLDNITGGLKQLIDSGQLMNDVITIGNNVLTFFDGLIKNLFGDLHQIDSLSDFIDEIDKFEKIVNDAVSSGDWTEFNNLLKTYGASINQYFSNIWNALTTLNFGEIFEKIKTKFGNVYRSISGYFSVFGDKLQQFKDYVKDTQGIDISKLPVFITMGLFMYMLVLLIARMSNVVKICGQFIKVGIKIGETIKSTIKSVRKLIDSYSMMYRAKAFKDAGFAMVELAGAVAILAGAMWLISKISSEKLQEAVAIIMLTITALTGLSIVLSKYNGDKGAISIAAVAGSLFLLVIAMKILTSMPDGISGKAFLSVFGMLFLFSIMLAEIVILGKYSEGCLRAAGTILIAALAMIAIIGVFVMMSKIRFSPDECINILGNMVGVILTMAILMMITSTAGAHSLKAGIGMLAMVAAMMLIVPALYMLSALPNSVIKKATKTIYRLMSIFAVIILASSLAGPNSHKAALVLVAMAFALIPIAMVVWMFGSMDVLDLMKGVTAVSIIVYMFSILVAASSLVKSGIGTLAGIALIIAVMGLVVAGLSLMDPKRVLVSAVGLGALALALAGMMLILSLIPKEMIFYALASAVAMVAVAAALGYLVYWMSNIKNIDTAERSCYLLMEMLGAMTLAAIILAGVGSAGPAVFVGIAGLAALIAGVGGILAAAAAINEKWDAAEKIRAGIPVMEAVAEGLGRFLGTLYGSFSEAIMDSVLENAKKLAVMILVITNSVLPLGSMPSDISEKATSIAAAIAVLTAADFISGLGGLLKLAGLDTFSAQMDSFGKGINTLAESVNSLDMSTIRKISAVGKAGQEIGTMMKSIPTKDGFVNRIFGTKDMEGFTEGLTGYIDAIQTISDTEYDIDLNKISLLAQAGTKLGDMAHNIPNSGESLLSLIVGDNDAGDFGTSIANFAESLATASGYAKDINTGYIGKLTTAGAKLIEMADTIPNEGGVWGFIAGNNEAGAFGTGIRDFAWMVSRASNISTSIVPDKFQNLTDATEKLNYIGTLIDAVDLAPFSGFERVFDGYASWMKGFGGEGVVSGIGILGSMTTMMKTVVDELGNYDSRFKNAGRDSADAYVDGVKGKRSTAKSSARSLAMDAMLEMKLVRPEFYNAGRFVIDGFINGMESKRIGVKDKAESLGQESVDGVNKGAGNNSPSHKTFKSGVYIAQGLINGMDHMSTVTSRSGYNLGETSVVAIADAIQGIQNVVDHDMEIRPRIRPVVDLSDVNKGVDAISAMYNRDQVATVARGRQAVLDRTSGSDASATIASTNYSFTQNNYSPKALSQTDIYRKTKNQFALAVNKGVLTPV